MVRGQGKEIMFTFLPVSWRFVKLVCRKMELLLCERGVACSAFLLAQINAVSWLILSPVCDAVRPVVL